MEGNGRIFYIDGSNFVGEFENNQLNGKGELFDSNGLSI